MTTFSKKQLTIALKKYAVTAAYLFGSQASGKTHSKSDTDIAVRFGKDLSLQKKLELIAKLSKIFQNEVDLLDLEISPLPVQFRVYQARKLLYAQNPKQEVLLQAKALCL